MSCFYKNFYSFLLVCLIVLVAGCATVPESHPVQVQKRTQAVTPKKEKLAKGVYHKVKPGETLWRIAKEYDVSVEDIVQANKIPSGAYIEKNQLLLIPGAKQKVSFKEDLRKNEFAWPIKGKVIFYFNQPDGSHLSRGIGIQAFEGETVKASREGKVVFADRLAGYRDTVIIDHEDGFYSVYAENSKLLVATGQHVLKGDPIALVGKSGDLAFLHFEIRKHSVADNPLYYLP